MTKQKKPKTGDVVGWVVVDGQSYIYDENPTRDDARKSLKMSAQFGPHPPYRVAKIVLA